MSRKNNAILAIGALAAFGFASSAFAQCPASPTPPWSAAPQLQGTVAIAEGGLDGTSCRLDSRINAGASGAAIAAVRDETPATEARYRAQFVVDTDNLTNLQTLESVRLFVANSPAHLGRNQPVILSIFGLAGAKRLNVRTVNEGVPGNSVTQSAALATGENRIEIDWVAGNPGSLKVWINSTDEASPTLTFDNLNNTNWQGIDQVSLGLSIPSAQFVTVQNGRTVAFDEFDSRRSSFIGE